MKATIETQQTLFIIKSAWNQKTYCNLRTMNKAVKELNAPNFTIYFLSEDLKVKKISKKVLKELFAGSGLTQEFKY